jgi:hypothetical protein
MLTLAVGISFGLVPSSEACRAVAPHPWAAFQQISSVEQARTILAACQADHLRAGMWIDALAFIPVYAAFLLAAFWAARARHIVALIGVAMLAVGIVADEIEGLRLLGIIDSGATSQALILAANRATFGKDLFLGLATATAGLAFWMMPGWVRAAGALMIAAAVAAVVSTMLGQSNALLMLIAWLTILFVALAKSVAKT